jgi:zinc transporter ZupT
MAGASIGLITLVGIVLPFWIARIEPFLVNVLVALAAGTFIYLGATLLIPLSEAGKSRNITFLVALGCVVFFLSNWLAREFLGH